MAEGGEEFNSDISTDESSYISAASTEQQTLSSNTEPNKFPMQELSPQEISSETETLFSYPPTTRPGRQVAVVPTDISTLFQTSLNLDNSEGSVLIVHNRRKVPGESAVIDNVLTKPNLLLGYENVSSPFVDRVFPSTSQQQPVRYPEYKDELTRLRSFQIYGWPHNLPSPRRLALSNMFFNGTVRHADGTEDIDLVVCYRCGGTLCKFHPTDDPFTEHRTWYPRCYKTNWEF